MELKVVKVHVSEEDNNLFERFRYNVIGLENIITLIASRMERPEAFSDFYAQYTEAIKEFDAYKIKFEEKYMSAYPTRVRWDYDPYTRELSIYMRKLVKLNDDGTECDIE